MSTIDVSVIIPCHNAGQHLRELLISLHQQDLPQGCEVVLADNRSSDDSVQVAREFQSLIPLRIVRAPDKRGAAYARNVGARNAKGSKLLFIDADDVVRPGYVSSMAAALDDHALVTSCVDSRTLNPRWSYEALGEWQVSSLMEATPLPKAGIQVHPLGANLGIHRSLFESVGGWPEAFQTPSSEDISFAWRVQLTGASVHLVTDAVYLYRHGRTMRDLFFQHVRWEMSTPLLYRQFRELGMPRRTLRDAGAEWLSIARQAVKARTKGDFAKILVRAGISLGRLLGSVRHAAFFP